MKKKKKRISSTVLLFIIFFAGLSLLLYPSIANYWNSFHSSRAIANYSETVNNLNEQEYAEIFRKAEEYNRDLPSHFKHKLTESEMKRYEGLLNVAGNGMMGQIEIRSIGVSLPIYHTTSDIVLQNGVGHVEWSSLPVGGKTSHCVLSGHRGLPSAKLFTQLDRLVEGDVFTLRVLNEVLTYEVDQILIVEPADITSLELVDGKDYCTLVTCTPYGINTHRLLVRGHRIENAADASAMRIAADATQIEELLVASMLAFPILLGLLLYLLIRPKKGKKKEKKAKKEDKSDAE